MPRPTIEEVRGVGDFATVYQWNVDFTTFPTVAGAPGSYPDTTGVNFRCESAELPKATSQKITAEIRGHKVHQPGIQEYNGQITLVLIETVDNLMQLFLTAWREACWEVRTGKQSLREECECNILLERLNRQNDRIWGYDVVGCFLEDYEIGTLDGASSEFFKPSLTISYDYFEDKP